MFHLGKELVQAKRTIKLEGTSFNKLSILEYIGSCPDRKFAYYKCCCNVCGKEFISSNASLRGNKYSEGCKNCVSRVNGLKCRIHGFPKNHKTYKSWCKIKERCYNPNDFSYCDYGALGIGMDSEFKDNFLAFYNEVGEPPENAQCWSVDRIDNTKGYVKGNLRWANTFQQARNKSKSISNTSGVCGVQWYNQEYTLRNGEIKYALQVVTTWSEVTNGQQKQRNKKFSVRKLGLLPAFAAACAYRELKIKELNKLGYGYSDNHGK